MTTTGTITPGQDGRLAGFLAHERGTKGTHNIVYLYEIARGEIAKGKGWETGTAMICELIDDYSDWANEYHLITRSRVGEGRVGINYNRSRGDSWVTDLYGKFEFKKTNDVNIMLCEPEWNEDYWIASAPDALRRVNELREGQAREWESKWEFKKVESITNTPVAKEIKKIFMKTHKTDRGGDGKSWTEYDQEMRHILAYRGQGNKEGTGDTEHDMTLLREGPLLSLRNTEQDSMNENEETEETEDMEA